MKFGIDRLIAEPALRAPLIGQARGVARASRFRHGRPDALAGCAGRMRRHEDQRRLRSAAWPARRQARQHDRVAGLQRSGAWHSGLQPLWRRAQADGCDDGCIRCDPRRSAGSGLSNLYVHHDPALRPRSGIATSQDCLGAGSAQSCGSASRRSDAARRLGKLCRRRTVADASWAHARRAGSVVRQNAQARCRVSGHRDAGLAARCRARVRLAAGRAHVDQSQSQRTELVDGARLCGHGDARGHDALGRTRHHSAARTVRRSRYRCAGRS